MPESILNSDEQKQLEWSKNWHTQRVNYMPWTDEQKAAYLRAIDSTYDEGGLTKDPYKAMGFTPKGNNININYENAENTTYGNMARGSGLVHELAHKLSYNANNELNAIDNSIPTQEEALLRAQKLNRLMHPLEIGGLKNANNFVDYNAQKGVAQKQEKIFRKNGIYNSKNVEDDAYGHNAIEVKAKLDELRYRLNLGPEQMNIRPESVKMWRERGIFPSSLDDYSDEQIAKMLNTFAYNGNGNVANYAKQGGKLTKYSELNDKDRWAAIRAGVKAGYNSIDDIEKAYNEYAEGGSLKQDDYYNNVVLQKDDEQKQQIEEQLKERRTYADGGKIKEIQSLFKSNPIEAKKMWDSLSDDDKKAYGVEGGFWNVVNDISHKFGGDDNSKITNRHTSKIHVYKSGESTRDIANMYGVNENDIELVNPNWIDGFKEGQQIIIPDEHDLKIAKMQNYGWNDANERGKYDKEYLSKNVNATLGFDRIGYFINGYSYLLGKNLGERSVGENPKNQAWFNRHLGYNRNFKELPLSTVKFTGDYNKDGSLKWPNAEYVGLTQYWKNKIREAIKNGEINPKEDWSNATENGGLVNPLGRFAIRENNNSGIYDVFDTYDFRGDDQDIVPNRNIGYDIEVRDTIHGVNAKPELYDINYTKRK